MLHTSGAWCIGSKPVTASGKSPVVLGTSHHCKWCMNAMKQVAKRRANQFLLQCPDIKVNKIHKLFIAAGHFHGLDVLHIKNHSSNSCNNNSNRQPYKTRLMLQSVQFLGITPSFIILAKASITACPLSQPPFCSSRATSAAGMNAQQPRTITSVILSPADCAGVS